jgi:predicted amino acid-binding ACT domain protein
MASDITYDGVTALMAHARTDAETNAAVQQQLSRNAEAISDQMQAIGVDAVTLGAMADHLDAQKAAVTAQQRVQETAESVDAALKRGHAGLAEAHQNAPVQAADREFYVG